MFKSPRSV